MIQILSNQASISTAVQVQIKEAVSTTRKGLVSFTPPNTPSRTGPSKVSSNTHGSGSRSPSRLKLFFLEQATEKGSGGMESQVDGASAKAA
jgi:hypothetical protein